MPLMNLLPRQTIGNNDDGNDRGDLYYDSWWYSSTAYAIKWAIIGAIFLLFLAFFVGGFLHAKRRMKNGLAPLAYHRWLISRRHRIAFHQAHPHLPNPHAGQYNGPNAFYRPGYGEQRGYGYGPQQDYPMAPMYGPPPPAYGEPDYVPPYAPPEGASKVARDQGGYVRETGNTQGGAQGQGQESGVVGGGSSQGLGQGLGQGQVPNQNHPGGDLGNRHV